MKTLEQHLTAYAAYHRDRRNIATHFVGIPMIVLAVTTLLARPALPILLVPMASAIVFYFILDVRFGLAMAALMGAASWAGWVFASLSLTEWLVAGVGFFVVGWIIQFIGHAFEGRKPAFLDDIASMLVGPLFVVAELTFALGLRDDLRTRIEAKVGPTLVRVKAAPAQPTS
jgi:uncharacterized membrane protein YGL010W